MGAWHLGYFRAEIFPGSHGDISLVLPDVAALSPNGDGGSSDLPHLTAHREGSKGWEWEGAGSR